MSSMSTRFDYVIYVDMKKVGNEKLTYNLLVCKLIVFSQESGELN